MTAMDSRPGIADALQHRLVFLAETQRFDHEHHEIRIGERATRPCGSWRD